MINGNKNNVTCLWVANKTIIIIRFTYREVFLSKIKFLGSTGFEIVNKKSLEPRSPEEKLNSKETLNIFTFKKL